MTNSRKACTINLLAGLVLILLGMGGIINIAFTSLSSLGLFWAMIFLALLVLLGGYEAGKYTEMRHEQPKEKTQVT
jgi:Na+(H+)/acetate symporter ActP